MFITSPPRSPHSMSALTADILAIIASLTLSNDDSNDDTNDDSNDDTDDDIDIDDRIQIISTTIPSLLGLKNDGASHHSGFNDYEIDA